MAALVISCGGGKGNCNIVKGSASQFDTLSYAVGLDVASGLKGDLGGMKLNFDLMKEGVELSALGGKSFKMNGLVVTREVSDSILGNFFRNEYGRRIQILRTNERAESDTTGRLNPVAMDFDPETMFVSEDERSLISKSFGFDMGNRLGSNPFVLHLLWFFQGMDDFDTENAKMTQEESSSYIIDYLTVKLPAQNQKESEEWLAGIEKKSGVKKTESGLLYKIVKEGDVNVKPAATDLVKVHYKGETRKGVVFDASRFKDMSAERQEMMKKYNPNAAKQDEPVEFPLNAVIKGWTEGLQLIGKGGTIELWIPAELAYGSRGAGQNIAPNEALYFKVDLIDVNVKDEDSQSEQK